MILDQLQGAGQGLFLLRWPTRLPGKYFCFTVGKLRGCKVSISMCRAETELARYTQALADSLLPGIWDKPCKAWRPPKYYERG